MDYFHPEPVFMDYFHPEPVFSSLQINLEFDYMLSLLSRTDKKNGKMRRFGSSGKIYLKLGFLYAYK
jgi:hypothetical protein